MSKRKNKLLEHYRKDRIYDPIGTPSLLIVGLSIATLITIIGLLINP